MTVTEGSSNSNAGCNLVLISGTGSADGGTSSILGSSGGSGFGSATAAVSGHSKVDLLQHHLDLLTSSMAD